MTVLTATNSGGSVETGVGEVVAVQLPENPTTGYRWMVEAGDGLEEIGSTSSQAGSAVGAAGVREFQFRVSRAGSHNLRLKHWRDWEGESSVIGRFNVTIVAK